MQDEWIYLTKKILGYFSDNDVEICLTKKGYQGGVPKCFGYTNQETVNNLQKRGIINKIKENNLHFYIPTTNTPKIPVFECKFFPKIAKKLLCPTYDKKKHILYVNQKPVHIPYDTNMDYLCRVIFSNQMSLERTWDHLDIIGKTKGEIWGREGDHKSIKRKTYNAIVGVNKKVKEKTNTDTFFEYLKGTIKINQVCL